MRNYQDDKLWVYLIEIKFLAGRICSIINDWEQLKEVKFSKAIRLNMTENRITGTKEVINVLHKCKHEIRYVNIHLLNESYTKELTIN